MVETTQTSEALASALGGDGLMQSEYYKLVFNDETGQWEKQKVTEDIEPVFPGIRDVTPEYTAEGKTFKTIPIGAGPDYSPVVPDVPELPITQPVEPVVPEEPEVSQPVVTQPDQGPRPDPMDIPTFVNKEKTTVTVGDNVFPSTVIKNLPSYRDKYQSLPGGFNNWSDSQVLQYAIDTGALNSMLSQTNNPYYIAEPEKQTGIMADIKATLPLPLQIGAKALDATLGVRERKALVKRMIDAGMLFGEANNYLDEKGNFKSNDVGRLLKTFKDDNAPQNGLVSPDTNIYESVRERQPFEVAQDKSPSVIRNSSIEEYFGTSAGTSEKELRQRINEMNLEISYYEDLQTEFDTKGTYKGKYAFGKDISNQRFKDLDALTKLQAEKTDILKKIENEDYGKTIYDPTDRTYKSITPELEKKLEQLKTTQAAALEGAQKMGEVGIRGVGDTANPLLSTVPQPSFIDTLQQFSIQDNKIVPGISQSQPVMGTSGSHVNGEAVYVNSEAGHYTSDGKYHADTNGDGITDTVQAGGSASNAQETANSGFIPQAVLDRMTNPDGSLKNLYTPQGGPTGSYGLSSDVMELRDGKYYYTGNVVKENRDVVDNGGNGNTIDNAAPDNSNDNNSYNYNQEMEKAKEDPSNENYTQANYEAASGTGSGSSDTSSKDKKDKIVCTEMYRQTQLDDWQRTIKLWYLFQKKYLSETHQKGYHFLFKPFVKGMQKSNILTSIGRHFAQERTKDIKHIMYGTKFSLLGRVYRIILEPICFLVGLLLWQNK
jgi:hypothetical protein